MELSFASSQTPLDMAPQGAASRIVVMGTTGSGKSTFINLLSGSTLAVSDGLKSCTFEVLESRPFTFDDRNVILIDTPGFDDTTRSDTDIIATISTYLADIYKQGIEICGVIYMHRISDVRMCGTSLLSFRIFRGLCGNESLPSALIVTTMWSGVNPQLGESREQELATSDDLFKPVLDHGAQLVRHDGTLESAQTILRRLTINKGTTLRIQHELVTEGKKLADTDAGAELVHHFAEQAGRLEARSRKLHKQMKEALLTQDQEGCAMLQLELDEMQKVKRRIEDENECLRRMMPSTVDARGDWVSIECPRGGPNPLDGPQFELPEMEQIRMVLGEEITRLQERLQNEEHRRIIAALEKQAEAMHRAELGKRREKSERTYLTFFGVAALLKLFEIFAYSVFPQNK